MNIKEYKEALFSYGEKLGFSDMELYHQANEKYRLKVYKENIDNFEISVESGLSFRGKYKGKTGYAYTENMEIEAISMLLQEAKENSKIIDSNDTEVFFHGSEKYEKLEIFSEELASVSTEEMVSFLQQVERECYRLSDKVFNVKDCVIEYQNFENVIANSKGLFKSEKSNTISTFVSVIVKDATNFRNGYKHSFFRDFYGMDYRAIAKAPVEEALSLVGGESIESKSYPIILKNTASASLLQVFSEIFSAENVQTGKSQLGNLMRKDIANSCVNLVDDPFYVDGYKSRSFDSEGVATNRLKIIENGVLITYLHNLKSAIKNGNQSTGNAHKSSYKAPMGISPSNMYIVPGSFSFEELVQMEKEVIVITDLQGLHSGANRISGDFSLAAQGYLVKEGKKERAISQITLAGNFYTMLKNIENIANDVEFCMPLNDGFFGSPSLKVKELSVGGN